MNIKCPACSKVLNIPEAAAGKVVKCPCGNQMRAPGGTPASQPKAATPGTPAKPTAPAAGQRPAPAAGPKPAAQGTRPAAAGTKPTASAPRPAAPAPRPAASGGVGDFDAGMRDELTSNDLRPVTAVPKPAVAAVPRAPGSPGKASPYTPPQTQSKGGGGGQPIPGYNTARVGMRIVFISWSTMLAFFVLLYLFGWLARLAPDAITAIANTVGATTMSVIALTSIGLTLIAVFMVFVGQIVCIFAPQKDEKLFAGLAVGALVSGILLPMITIFAGAVATGVSEDTAAEQATAVAFGLGLLAVIAVSYLLILSNMFFFISYFQRIGRNIRSEEVIASAKVALLTWIGTIAVGVLCIIAAFVVSLSFQPPPPWIRYFADAIGLINFVSTCAVMTTLIMMVKKTLDHTTR
jgi:large-conductance mechanosensitive channel